MGMQHRQERQSNDQTSRRNGGENSPSPACSMERRNMKNAFWIFAVTAFVPLTCWYSFSQQSSRFDLVTVQAHELVQWIRASYSDLCTSNLTNESSSLGRLWLQHTNTTLRGYHVVSDETHSKCSVACAEALANRRVIWISGPPGSGKTTVTK